MLGNNSCGIHSMMGGRTVDNIHELDILTYDGLRMRVGSTDDEYERIVAAGDRRAEIYQDLRDLRDRDADGIRARFPKLPRRVSGYSIDELLPENGFHVARSLVGSESTCVLFLEATCRLVHSPPERSLVVLGFHDIAAAGDHVTEIAEYGPIGLEGIDDRLFEYLKRKGPTSCRRRPTPGTPASMTGLTSRAAGSRAGSASRATTSASPRPTNGASWPSSMITSSSGIRGRGSRRRSHRP
jgi:FAD/FMN-containing dehydrogenase